MEVRNCPKCGKVFTYTSKPICPSCEKEEEEMFKRVKDFIYENPDAKIKDIVDNTKTSAKKILQFIRDGRLEVTQGMHGEVTCQSCGKPISKGRFCDSCVIKINTDIETAFKPEAKPGKGTREGKSMLMNTIEKKRL